ncbi:MAG: hypothetical protein EP332_13150 [Bacteroidetes bacterium]|nr:MAG: hypothetical protein EP332_13150 [Bacteroidota bacterium]
MRITLILTLTSLFSCTSSPEKEGPVKCLQSTEDQELNLHYSEFDSLFSFLAPESWLTEFSLNSEASSVNSSDTSKELENTTTVSKSNYKYAAQDFSVFYQTCYSFLMNDLGVDLLDSGCYSLDQTKIHWIKYYNPTDTFSKSNTCLELFYTEKSRIANFRIVVYGKERTEERICAGYQVFLANKLNLLNNMAST